MAMIVCGALGFLVGGPVGVAIGLIIGVIIEKVWE
jgi:hypothetical protein